jgi:hypothetical protein
MPARHWYTRCQPPWSSVTDIYLSEQTVGSNARAPHSSHFQAMSDAAVATLRTRRRKSTRSFCLI